MPSPKGLCHQNITVLLYSVVEVQKNLEEIQIKSRIEAPCASRSVLYVPGAHAGQLAPPEPRALQPRPALRRLWAVSRLSCLGLGAIYAGSSIADYVQGGSNYDHSSYAAVSVAFLLCAALPTARNRSRLHRRLGRLGARGTVEEEAASVAELVGGSAPDATLERAAKLLRCLPASRLHAADLADKSTASSDGPKRSTRARSRRRWGK